jgi:hypothetical protein
MRDLLTLTIHLLVTCIKLLRPGGVRAVAAESLLLKHQILISNRSRGSVTAGKSSQILIWGQCVSDVACHRPCVKRLGAEESVSFGGRLMPCPIEQVQYR